MKSKNRTKEGGTHGLSYTGDKLRMATCAFFILICQAAQCATVTYTQILPHRQETGRSLQIYACSADEALVKIAFIEAGIPFNCTEETVFKEQQCKYQNGNFNGTFCHRLRLQENQILLENISTPVRICALAKCPNRNQSIISINVDPTTAPEVTNTGTRSTAKTTVSIPDSSSVSSKWKDTAIIFIFLFITVFIVLLAAVVRSLVVWKSQRNLTISRQSGEQDCNEALARKEQRV